jgi:hypothetical protein
VLTVCMVHVLHIFSTLSFAAEDEQVLVTEEDFPEVKVDFQVSYSLFHYYIIPFCSHLYD